jgi:hypothetical protein
MKTRTLELFTFLAYASIHTATLTKQLIRISNDHNGMREENARFRRERISPNAITRTSAV